MTDNQPADIFTKTLAEPFLIKHWKLIMRWKLGESMYDLDLEKAKF